MKKRILAVCLALCLALTLLPGTAIAAEVVAFGECGDNVTWSYDNTSTLTISGTGAMWNCKHEWMTDVEPWLTYNEQIKNIIIEDGITRIGNEGFGSGQFIMDAWKPYTKLESISISDSVVEIGQFAFSSLDIPTIVLPR